MSTGGTRLSVLYVVDDWGAPTRYRCLQGAEQLRRAGVVANVVSLAAVAEAAAIREYSLVVLFRLAWSPAVEKVVGWVREVGGRVAFESDDSIFDLELIDQIPFAGKLDGPRQEAFRVRVAALKRTLQSADLFITSTAAIAHQAKGLGKPVVVHPNLVSPEYVRLSNVVVPLRSVLQAQPLLGYMSGSDTHDGDLGSISGPIRKLLERRPEVRLVICGFLQLPPELHAVRDRVLSISFQNFRVLPWIMARCRALLAPLECLNAFTQAKSNIKVLEAGIFGIASIASPSEEYGRTIDAGVTGFLPSSGTEWLEAMDRLCDPRVALSMGRAARERVRREFTFVARAGELARHLSAFASESLHSPPAIRRLAPPVPPRKPIDWARLSYRALRLALTRDLRHLTKLPHESSQVW